ncbi:unnamed protein product, partial [Nesidiocoris tenuis]
MEAALQAGDVLKDRLQRPARKLIVTRRIFYNCIGEVHFDRETVVFPDFLHSCFFTNNMTRENGVQESTIMWELPRTPNVGAPRIPVGEKVNGKNWSCRKIHYYLSDQHPLQKLWKLIPPVRKENITNTGPLLAEESLTWRSSAHYQVGKTLKPKSS